MSFRRLVLILLVILGALSATGCLPTADAATHAITPTLPSVPSIVAATPAPTLSPIPTQTAVPPSIWLPQVLPGEILSEEALPEGWFAAQSPDLASLRFEINAGQPLSAWVYALVAPFPTLTDAVTSAEIQTLWKDGQPPNTEFSALTLDPASAALFTELWGMPSASVQAVPAGQLLDLAWKKRTTWSLIPFGAISARWKVIAVDGQNPLHKEFDPLTYALTVNFGITGEADQIEAFLAAGAAITPTNRRADRLTTVMLTGVTALVRGTASTMESRGMTYPAQEIGPWLREADILHINNEVPFAKNCPSPYPWSGLVFCSQTRYIELLDDIGVDVMDLSGDHFADWGAAAMRYTLDLYQQRGWPIYGGGATAEEAQQPALFEHNGNRIAFIGCNYKAKGYATASATNPGAVHCDPAWLYPAIQAAVKDGYLPIVTFQHEEYYEYIARPQLQADFRGAAEAGAVIVSGSQAHQPHALDFDGQALIHYGLGNLFFDQIGSMESTNSAFIDRHVFYDGRYLGVELLSIRFVDYARPRPTSAEEREALLNKVFTASGW